MIPGVATVHARSHIGTPTPPSTRYRLQRVGVLLAHEVGVNTPATGRYRSSDPVRVLSDARAAAAYGISTNRPWEYSYMIGLDRSIFTQAGEFMAAHCRGFNTDSAAVLFLNAVDVPLNAGQIDAWHELRAHMVAEGIVAADHTVGPHYRYRSTSCCGIHAEKPGAPWSSPTGEGRLGNLIPALAVTPIAPTSPTIPPTTEDDDDMALFAYYVLPPTELQGSPELVVVNASVRYRNNEDVDGIVPSVRFERSTHGDQYERALRSAGLA